MLRYIYTGGVEEAQLHCVELFVVAAEYQLEALTKRCSHQIVTARRGFSQVDAAAGAPPLQRRPQADLLPLHQATRRQGPRAKGICWTGRDHKSAWFSWVTGKPEIMALTTEDAELWGELREPVSGSRPKPAAGGGSGKRHKTQVGSG